MNGEERYIESIGWTVMHKSRKIFTSNYMMRPLIVIIVIDVKIKTQKIGRMGGLL